MFTHLGIIKPIDIKVINGPSGRFYVSPITDEKYPSITTMLGAKEKPHLKEWRNMLGADKADKEMKRCADRGTAVHQMIEDYLNNKPEPTKGMDPAHVREFNQVRLKLNKINNIHTQEVALWSDDLRLAGRVDCIGEYEGELAVIDFKTSNGDKKESMIEDYFLQTTFYALAYHEIYGIQIDRLVIIMSTEKGIVPLVFKGRVEDYILPLVERVNSYYTSNSQLLI